MTTPPFGYGVSLYSYTGEFGVTMTLDDCIEDVADIGATGLELMGESHVADYPNPSTAWIDAWFARLERYNLTPTCSCTWVDSRRFPDRALSVDEAAAQLATDITLASMLGFKFIRPKFGVVTWDLEPDPTWLPATERVLDLAEKKGITICPEIHWPTAIKTKTVDEYIAFKERTGTNNFGLLLDTGVFMTRMHPRPGWPKYQAGTGAYPLELATVPVSDAEAILEHVVYVQAKFYEIDDDLNDFNIPWKEFLELIIRRGWSGWLSSEYEGGFAAGLPADQLRRQHALLRKLTGEILGKQA